MPATTFSCTACGVCCHNHSLPLTLDESIEWLEGGGHVAVFCEATLWFVEPSSDDARAAHRKLRSFPVCSGTSQARVMAILVAVISGACKFLGDDNKCKNYERRPLVCRIYPAEVSPFIAFDPSRKVCPSEAWVSETVLLSDGKVVDPHLLSLIEQSRQSDRDEASKKGLLCQMMNIDVAAIADEGFVAHEPDQKALLEALRAVRAVDSTDVSPQSWQLYSKVSKTLGSLRASGMTTLSEKPPEATYTFLHAPR